MSTAKIIATLGPASSTETVLRKMFENGLDTVRLNFSHGSHEEHLKRIQIVRTLNRKLRRAVKIMMDLEGFRIRIGELSHPIPLIKGERYALTNRNVRTREHIPFDYQGPLQVFKKGTRIFVDDGRIALEVTEADTVKLKVRVIVGGELKSRKGVNIPEVSLDVPDLTPKDRADIEFAVSEGADAVAQSFVRDGKDIHTVRELLRPRLRDCRIVAKIENRKALENIDDIISEADEIMVARGDLGISVPIYEVPMIQKDIIPRCLKAGKPVIVATQMLESMTEESIPTRAEVSDVANAILDGATHVMLSAESAVGKHPPLVVDMMNKIIGYTEQYRARAADRP